jgi:malonyl-CoA O-methyltransferase
MMLTRLKRLLRRPIRTLSSVDAYERWAENYPPYAHNALMELEQAAMLDLLPSVTGMTVLDLACGTGRYGILARERGARLVIGVDNSRAMLTTAAARFPCALAATGAVPLARRTVDGVICGLALGHLPGIQPSLNEIARVLKPGGWTLISDIHAQVAARGAQRTFTAADGKVYAVEHYSHTRGDYERAAHQAGLTVDKVREPHLADSSEPVLLLLCLYRPPS